MFTQKQIEAAGEALRKECLAVFGSTWSYDNAWRFAKAALEAAEAAAWEPIDSAPKNKERLLVYSEYEADDLTPQIATFRNGKWFIAWDHTEMGEDYFEPTHWRPLPPAPTAAASDPKSQTHE